MSRFWHTGGRRGASAPRRFLLFLMVATTALFVTTPISALGDERTLSGTITITTPDLPGEYRFEVAEGDSTFTEQDVSNAVPGSVTINFFNHVGTDPPVVKTDVCPGRNGGQHYGVRVWLQGLSVGAQVEAVFVYGTDRTEGYGVVTGVADAVVRVCAKP